MKTTTLQLLTFSIWIGALAGTQLSAQQTNLDKRTTRTATSRTMYVAQQVDAALNTQLPTQNSTPAPTDTPPIQPIQQSESDAAPGQFFPGVMPTEQSSEIIGSEMMGADNGLWDGCSAGNCCAICGGGYATPPLWYTDQGARIISRSRPRRIGLGQEYVQGVNPLTGQLQIVAKNVLTTKSINYDAAVGYSGTIGRYLGRDSMDRDDFLEFGYWGMNTWVDSTTVQGSRVTDANTASTTEPIPPYPDHTITFGSLQSPFLTDIYQITGTNNVTGFGPGGFNNADLQTFTVNSEIHNWELNLRLRPRGRPDQLVLHPNGRWRRECQPGAFMSYLVGLRYLTLGDGAYWHSQGTIVNNGVVNFVTGDYNVKTENDLLGMQIGADLMFRQCKWAWGIRAKLGPYVNFASDAQDIVNNAHGVAYNTLDLNTRLTARKQLISLIGEVGFEATYRFKPNLMGRAAYDFMWINGLALAPEQYQFNSDPIAAINTNGSIFSQGLSLNLEWSW